MRAFIVLIGLMVVTAMISPPARAGVYGDDLAKCLLSKTSDEEKIALAQWIFSIISVHPSVASIATVSDEGRTQASKKTALVFQQLLTDSCKDETTKAVKYEGTDAIKGSFKVLGEIAMNTLLTDPKVSAESQKFVEFMDEKKLNTVFGSTPAGD
jgi:hypothetical protein